MNDKNYPTGGRCVLGIVVLLFGVPHAWAQPAGFLQGESRSQDRRTDPWAASAISVTNTLSTLSFDKSAEPFYNPTDIIVVTGQVRYAFNQDICLGIGGGMSRELTTPDTRTNVDDVWFADTTILLCLLRRQIPFLGLRVALDAVTYLPTSPISASASLITGGELRGTLRRIFDVAWTPSMTYQFSGRANVHEYTSRQQDAPSIAACSGSECAELAHTGVRNAWAQQAHGVMFGVQPVERLSVGLNTSVLVSHLYRLTPAERTVTAGRADVHTRYAMSYGLSMTFQFAAGMSSTLAVRTFNPQQAPDSKYYSPFFNRFSQVSLGLTMNPSTWFN